MHTQVRTFDFTGQNVYAGIDVHKKNWRVTVYSEQLYHKSFHQPADPVDSNKLARHLRNGDLEAIYPHEKEQGHNKNS